MNVVAERKIIKVYILFMLNILTYLLLGKQPTYQIAYNLIIDTLYTIFKM